MFVVLMDQLLFVKVSSSKTKHGYICKVHRVCTFTGELHHLAFCHLVAIRIRTNKMAKGDKYLNKTSE